MGEKRLIPLESRLPRRASTGYALSGALQDEQSAGLCRFADFDSALFDSSAKFSSGTSGPSFQKVLALENLKQKKDFKTGVLRTDLKCTLCDAYLGGLLGDGLGTTRLSAGA